MRRCTCVTSKSIAPTPVNPFTFSRTLRPECGIRVPLALSARCRRGSSTVPSSTLDRRDMQHTTPKDLRWLRASDRSLVDPPPVRIHECEGRRPNTSWNNVHVDVCSPTMASHWLLGAGPFPVRRCSSVHHPFQPCCPSGLSPPRPFLAVYGVSPIIISLVVNHVLVVHIETARF